MKSVFLGESKSDLRGAEGLLESIKIAFSNLGIENVAKSKLTGLSTDSENANTGKNSGLWPRMKNYLQRDLLTVWCVAHRADLAMSDLKRTVTEVLHWKTNIKSLATFYRASSIRFGELEKVAKSENQCAYHFPAYFEVRFVEHLKNLAKAVWKMLPFMLEHWNKWRNRSRFYN